MQNYDLNQELIIDSGSSRLNDFSGIQAEIMNKLLFSVEPNWLRDVILSIEHKESNGKIIKYVRVFPKSN